MELEKISSVIKEDEQQDTPSFTLTEEKSSNEVFMELLNSAGKEASKIWKIEVLYGWHSKSGRYKHVVKITCRLDGQEFYYLLEDLRDKKKLENVVNSLGSIAMIKPSYIKHFTECADQMILERKVMIVEDGISKYVPFDLGSLNALQHYEVIYRHVLDNLELFPKKSSNAFEKDNHEGAILDKEFPVNENGSFTVAYVREDFRRLFQSRSSNEYNEILEGLYTLGVLAAKQTKASKNISSERFTIEKTLAKGVEVKYFAIRIDPSLIRGGKF
ncbi:hypothetical protein P4V39_17360 [Brevibacillus borstelensis]|uniref:hypothetical protein n=1 Tax=Brevibacillus borstelensis TaxID=45462 RepID=UPI002E1CD90F|nr:hypothetical protein [Brevibacillus borstelensis]